MGEQTGVEIGTIILNWSPWTPWRDVLLDNRGGAGVSIPRPADPGVYEVKYADHAAAERLHMGGPAALRMRIRQGLVKGAVPRSTGKRIRQRTRGLCPAW